MQPQPQQSICSCKANCNCVTPEKLQMYCYGYLNDAAYREKFAEFLKTDFPRVPYPKNKAEFDFYVSKGQRIASLDLMEASDIKNHKIAFCGAGDNVVYKPYYDAANSRVYINPNQYFENAPPTAWEAYIGGYQPAQKYLKDRGKTALDAATILHYSNVLYVLWQREIMIHTLAPDFTQQPKPQPQQCKNNPILQKIPILKKTRK